MMVRRVRDILRSLVRDESGNVIALTAVGIPLLLGCAGLAVDTIQWVSAKRELQSAADAAAIAGIELKWLASARAAVGPTCRIDSEVRTR